MKVNGRESVANMGRLYFEMIELQYKYFRVIMKIRDFSIVFPDMKSY